MFLSENTTSGQLDLVRLVQELRGIQRHTRRSTPLLVDENIHYRLLKLMHGCSTTMYDFRMWMASFPVLYGVWHPYKYCLSAIYRVFFPIFAILETTSPEVGNQLNGRRKVLHIEKLVLVLLLLRHKIADRIAASLQDTDASSNPTRQQVCFSRITASNSFFKDTNNQLEVA